ncbi:MAG: hypothetical protein JSS90_10240 [Bacteroidetes bacterium]|jgi:tetratricopeptide (TPR) repeat protein|nr:hypothetical protein [Bacteroidota bacterium]
MKNQLLFKLLLVVITGFLWSGCKMQSSNLQVLKPAEITLGDYIVNVGVINRTQPTKKNKAWNIAEGVLTGENIGADRKGSKATINGMIEVMKESPRFKLLQLDIDNLKGSGTGKFPEPLSKDVIADICQRNNLDALIALEAFDSDTDVKYTPITIRTKVAKDTYKDLPGIRADSRMNITAGWRIYNYKDQTIVDEYRYSDYLNFSGQGPNQDAALSALPSKIDALIKTGMHVGNSYGRRITPLWVSESREYYVKGNDALQKAAHMVKVGQWDKAADIWKREALNTHKKVAGRACYNMAVFSERLGNLDMALEWCSKAYSQFGNKNAQAYSSLIRTRMSEREVLKQQMLPENK